MYVNMQTEIMNKHELIYTILDMITLHHSFCELDSIREILISIQIRKREIE